MTADTSRAQPWRRPAPQSLNAAALLALLTGFLPATSPASAAPPAAPPADGIPSVSISAPASVSIGAPFTFTVTFDNTHAADTGYGPFIDLIFPVNGADGGAGVDTPDGIDFTGATYLGAAVNAVELTFPGPGGGTGCVSHPFARDTTGAYVQVCGPTGDKLVVLELPFGSFTSSQPAATISVGASLSNLADLGTPLTILARGGFRFGNTPLDDWCCDPVILLPTDNDGTNWPDADVTPTLISIAKAYNGPEDETATGPNFPRQYTITVTVAPGQTVTDLDVTDELPNNLAFLSVELGARGDGGPNAHCRSRRQPTEQPPGGQLPQRHGLGDRHVFILRASIGRQRDRRRPRRQRRRRHVRQSGRGGGRLGPG